MGALSLLTPCVFPMIPITVSYFTNHAGGNRKNAVFTAFVYAVGIILTFTALGYANCEHMNLTGRIRTAPLSTSRKQPMPAGSGRATAASSSAPSVHKFKYCLAEYRFVPNRSKNILRELGCISG